MSVLLGLAAAMAVYALVGTLCWISVWMDRHADTTDWSTHVAGCRNCHTGRRS